MRWIAAALLIAMHVALAAAADALPDALAAVVAATVYLPLLPLSVLGVPVFSAAEAGGWARPSAVGWLVLAVLWSVSWSLVVTLLRRRA